MPAKLSAEGAWGVRGAGLGNGAVLSHGPRHKPRPAQSPLTDVWPRPGATLDLDFARQRYYAYGRGQSNDLANAGITFSRASAATRTGPSGLLETLAADVPRIDYDPITLACKGLLIEEQRTNLLTYSEQFDNAAWTQGDSTITANAALAPGGATTADKLVESATTASHVASQAAVYSSGTYTASVYAKAGERNWLRLLTYDGANTFSGYFELSNGTVGSVTGTGTTSSIKSVGGAWYRCSITFTASAGTGSFAPRIATADGTSSYAGDGTSGLYLWGAQLEAGAFPTSYIPTTSAAVTRSADVASMTGANFSSWYNQSEGTLVIEFDQPNETASRQVVVLSDGTSGERLIVQTQTDRAGAEWRIVDGGVDQCDLLPAYSYGPGSAKLCAAYKANDFSISVAGLVVAADSSGTVPTPTKINLGSSHSDGSQINGHIARLIYFPRRLPNSVLQMLSQG